MKQAGKGLIILYYTLVVVVYFMLIVPLPFMFSTSGSIGSGIVTGIGMYILFYLFYLCIFGWFRQKINGRPFITNALWGLPATLFFMIFGSMIIEFVIPLPMNFESELGMLIGITNVIPLITAELPLKKA